MCSTIVRDLKTSDQLTSRRTLFASSSVLPIEGYGTVDINVTVNTDTQPIVRTIQLKDTALVSTFHTNVASLRKFIAKGVRWGTEYERLTRTLV
jgi:hypothetical protein